MPRLTLLPVILTMGGILFGSVPGALANGLFAQSTGLQCGACHQTEMETQGPAGLNQAGQTFETAYRGQCNFNANCAKLAAFPQTPAVTTTQTTQGLAQFRNTCNGQNEMIGLRGTKAALDQVFLLIIPPNTGIQVGVPKGSTWAGACGDQMINANSYQFIQISPAR
jgi:cytochrome c551/c552